MIKQRGYLERRIYANSLERLDTLHNFVVDGKDAEALLKYTARLRSDVEQEVLAAMLKPGSNIQELQIYYRLTDRFCTMLENAAATGKQKEESYAKLKAQLDKEE